MKRLTVGIFNDSFPPTIDGGSQRCRQLCRFYSEEVWGCGSGNPLVPENCG